MNSFSMLAMAGGTSLLDDTNIVKTIAFLIVVGILIYVKVPGLIAKLLDDRAEGIRKELAEAHALRDEAQALLASYERKQKEVVTQSADIVAHARKDAENAAEQAKLDLKEAIARRLQAAKDQIASAEADAMRAVRDRAVAVAVAAAGDVIRAGMSDADSENLIDGAIADVGSKLH
jgi:F-type H+-transporting ATPase subunit b